MNRVSEGSHRCKLLIFIVLSVLSGFINNIAAMESIQSGSAMLVKDDASIVQQAPKVEPKIKFSKIPKSEIKADIDLLENIDTKVIIALSMQFAEAIKNKDRTQFYQCFDTEEIVNKSLAGSIQQLGDLEKERQKIIRGFANIPDILVAKLGSRGHIKYLRVIKRNGLYRGLLRVKFNSGELSYLELIVAKNKEGKIKIVDFYDSMLGRNYTTIVSQMLISPQGQSVDLNKIVYFSKKPLSFQQRYAKTIEHYKKKEFVEALDSLQHLPTKFKATRDMLLLRAQIAKATNSNAYREALVLLHNKFSEEPDLALLLADHYYFSKQIPLALKSIDQFSDYIKGDIALETLRMKLHISVNDFKQATEVGQNAIIKDTSYEDIYWLLLKVYLHSYQYQHVGKTLDVLLDKFGAKFDIETFHKDSFYREYGFSKQFKKWKKSRVSQSKIENTIGN